MKMKIALAALACSGSLLAFLSTSASAAPLSGLSQSHGLAMADHPLLQKVHRWRRRGWGGGPYYGYGYGYGNGYGNGYGHGYGNGYGNGYSYYRPYPAYAPPVAYYQPPVVYYPPPVVYYPAPAVRYYGAPVVYPPDLDYVDTGYGGQY